MRNILLISLLCIPFISVNAQSKKEQIKILTFQADSLDQAIVKKKNEITKMDSMSVQLNKDIISLDRNISAQQLHADSVKSSMVLLDEKLSKATAEKQKVINSLMTWSDERADEADENGNELKLLISYKDEYNNIKTGFKRLIQSYTKIPKSQFKDFGIPENALSPIYVLQMSSNNRIIESVYYLKIENNKLLMFGSTLISIEENFGIKHKSFEKITEFDYKTN